MTLQVYSYSSVNEGSHFLILWWIHGNESCWTIAINKLIAQLNSWEISLLSWKLTLIPICNPIAFEHKVRFHEENLNRCFNPKSISDSYESRLAEMIREYISWCDYLLDIHSLSWGTDTFLFKSDYSWISDLDSFASASWIKQVISWRWEIYQDNWERCTDDYAYNIWIKWVCIECWQHEDPDAPEVAYRSIINMWKHLWLFDWKVDYIADQYRFHIERLCYKKYDGAFVRSRKHWDAIQAWTVIAKYDNWKKIIAEYDWFLLLPKHWAKKWDEWFYLWKKYSS